MAMIAAANGTNGGGGHTGASRHFGGSSRASRHAEMPIRRIAPSYPPANSAENMQFVQH
ncbi:MAG: hypothetical protein H0X30_25390 [Anaerolineae bacterium]|nr:hypothetical protein [Anaerolineae bacterium]